MHNNRRGPALTTILGPVALLAVIASAQTSSATADQEALKGPAPTGPCARGTFRDFDFWIGDWEVRDPDGNVAGTNSITLEENGCVVVEHWKSASGATGQSLNYYDPTAKRWKQRWIGLGLVLEMDGALEDGAMILQGPLHYLRENRDTLLRGTWTRLQDGRVRQRFDESDDDGKTWKPWFDGYYSRKAINH